MKTKISAAIVILCAISFSAFAGEAAGQFTAGKRDPIRPKYAAAFETRDQRDARKMAIEVVLSDSPIDVDAAVAELDPHTNVINQKAIFDHNYVLLWVRPDNDVSMNATYSATMTQFVEMTGDRMKAEMTTNTPDKVAGHIFSPKPLKTMNGDPYTIDLTFSTAVTRAPAGTKLPADGGEPGKAYKALQAAIAKKSWEGITANVSEKNRKSFTDADKTPKENLDSTIETLGFWLPKAVGKITGGELHGDSAVLNVEAEMFPGMNALYLIKMVKAGPRQLGTSDQMNNFRAVAVVSPGPCCEAVAKYRNTRTSCAEAPLIPHRACSMPDQCRCRFRKYTDRREGDDRRPAAWRQRGAWYNGIEKRSASFRRFADN